MDLIQYIPYLLLAGLAIMIILKLSKALIKLGIAITAVGFILTHKEQLLEIFENIKAVFAN